jgi:hypothetical protein
VPAPVAAAVRAALEERRPGQLRQRVELAVLPAFEVAYTSAAGARRTAWLVGDAREVRAPGVRWARLPFLAVIGLP